MSYQPEQLRTVTLQEEVNNPRLKSGDLCEAYTKRSLHKLNYFLQ